MGPVRVKGLFRAFNSIYLIQAKNAGGSIMSFADCQSVRFCCVNVFTLEISEMKKAVLEKGGWSKFGKPKVVSRPGPALTGVATPAKAVSPAPRRGGTSERQEPKKQSCRTAGQEATPAPRVIRVVHPQQGIGVPAAARPRLDGPTPGRVTEGQEVKPKPTHLRQTERIDEVNQMQTNTVVKPTTVDGHYSNSPPAVIEEGSAENKTRRSREPGKTEKLRREPPPRRSRDLQSGMELLGLDFLLSIVEDTTSNDELDVTMRRLDFKELIRTEQLHTVDSNALKEYALNADGHYDKTIQCEAIKELSARTAQGK